MSILYSHFYMKKHTLPIILSAIALISGIRLHAQAVNTYQDVWFLLNNHITLSDHWKLGNELHLRRTDYFHTQEQWLIRPSVTYTSPQGIAYAMGYTYISSAPYNNASVDISRPEHNIWEQVSLAQTLHKWKIQHRFRWEQRFSGHLAAQSTGYAIDGYDFSQRFRYRFTLHRPLNDHWFIHAFDELWIRTASGLSTPTYDRNWMYLGVGAHLTPQSSAQLAYLHQYNSIDASHYEFHPTIQLTLQYDFL